MPAAKDTTIKLRKRCYLDVAIGERAVGRIVVELFDDIVPKTAENFRGICTAEYGIGSTTAKKLSYVGVLFHRVIPGFMAQAGDFSAFDGTGGESIYGGKFEDENFKLKHDRAYLVSMANAGRDMNGSQFFITCVPCPSLDGKHVVFGHVIAGMEVVQEIERVKTDDNDRPLEAVRINKCGELVPVFPAHTASLRIKKKKKPARSSSSSDSDSGVEKKKRKKAKKKEAKEERKRLEIEQAQKIEPQAYCTIRPEEIPDIPQNNFLQRRTSPRPVIVSMAADSTVAKPEASTAGEPNGQHNKKTESHERPFYRPLRRDCEGITIKGRGAVRYSRRSVTPPHWRTRQTSPPFGRREDRIRTGDTARTITSSTERRAPENESRHHAILADKKDHDRSAGSRSRNERKVSDRPIGKRTHHRRSRSRSGTKNGHNSRTKSSRQQRPHSSDASGDERNRSPSPSSRLTGLQSVDKTIKSTEPSNNKLFALAGYSNIKGPSKSPSQSRNHHPGRSGRTSMSRERHRGSPYREKARKSGRRSRSRQNKPERSRSSSFAEKKRNYSKDKKISPSRSSSARRGRNGSSEKKLAQ